MRDVDELFAALGRSEFRSSMRLGEGELRYAASHSNDELASHARRFLIERLAPAEPANDGKQTPMRGHPVFVAQHATALCCRGCTAKWHRIPTGVALSDEQIDYAVGVIERWLAEALADAGVAPGERRPTLFEP